MFTLKELLKDAAIVYGIVFAIIAYCLLWVPFNGLLGIIGTLAIIFGFLVKILIDSIEIS
jgi:hypothetical protein